MSEKMFITKSPALPSRCVVCNNHAKGDKDFIDFGHDLDYYGAILICAECGHNLAKLIGYVSVAEVNRQIERAEGYALGWRQEIEKVQALEHIIDAYGFNRHLDSVAGSGDDLALPFESETPADLVADITSGKSK